MTTDATRDDLDIDTLVSMLGGLPEHRDQRLDLPLTEQVQILLDLACAHRPDFQRNVPVRATDHDVVITEVLVKLITALAERSGSVLFEGTQRELYERLLGAHEPLRAHWPDRVRVVAIDDTESTTE